MFQIGDSQFQSLNPTRKFPRPSMITVPELSWARSSKCHTSTLTLSPDKKQCSQYGFVFLHDKHSSTNLSHGHTHNCSSDASNLVHHRLISSRNKHFNHIFNLGLIAKLSLTSNLEKEHGPRTEDNVERGPEVAVSSHCDREVVTSQSELVGLIPFTFGSKRQMNLIGSLHTLNHHEDYPKTISQLRLLGWPVGKKCLKCSQLNVFCIDIKLEDDVDLTVCGGVCLVARLVYLVGFRQDSADRH